MTLMLPRRGFLGGLIAAFAAPAIVRAASLDPIRGTRFLLDPTGALTESLTSHDTLNFTYWVVQFGVQFGAICRMTGREILAAPQGTVLPWLPQVAQASDSSLKAFRPTNEHQAGLMFREESGQVRLMDLSKRFQADSVIARLRKEQDELLAQVRQQEALAYARRPISHYRPVMPRHYRNGPCR